jgi:streptogramin lyase/mono/diheme cytochrome c family protein
VEVGMALTQCRWFMTIAALVWSVIVVGFAQASAPQPWGGGKTNTVVDRFQKSYEILNHNEVTPNGAGRGQTLYYHKCLTCHYAGAAEGDTSGLVGPKLDDLAKLRTNEALVAKIKNGGPRMPAFKTNFTDADIADLVAYLKGTTCCYDFQEPPSNPHYRAKTVQWPVPTGVKGGPRGIVRTADGRRLEGIKVQVLAPNNVRTTVFTNADGQYEFPTLKTGAYTLRIATPLPWKAYFRENVAIMGANTLDDIVLELVPSPRSAGGHFVPDAFEATPEVMAQLSGSEWLWNLPGSMQEKVTFTKSCSVGCHSYENILRNRYDERSWRLWVERMRTAPSHVGPGRRLEPESLTSAEVDEIAKWLAKVRGPESTLDPVRVWPARPTGAATRVVVTEYEMSRRHLDLHDVCGPDAKGNIWYNGWHSRHIGYLDPRTGMITEYALPAMADGRPTIGTHACRVDNNRGYVWVTQGGGQIGTRSLFRLKMATGEVKQFMPAPFDNGGNNFGLAPNGSLWRERKTEGDGWEVVRVDPESGQVTNVYPRTVPNSYQTAVSNDGRFVAGGSMQGPGGNYAWMLDVKSGKVYESVTDDHHLHGAARGAFDPFGNAWFGGHWGPLVELVNEIDKGRGIQTRVFWPPTPLFPFTEFYTATPDKNGEVWGGLLHGKGFVRYNPKTERWIAYENPEPSSLNRFQMVDNSTTPPTIWYPDYQTGMIVRLQPLE